MDVWVQGDGSGTGACEAKHKCVDGNSRDGEPAYLARRYERVSVSQHASVLTGGLSKCGFRLLLQASH